jgi:signal transduction histidine kinase
MDKMVRTLLDVSRAGTGARLSLSFARCDLVAIARDIVETMTLTHGDRFVVRAPGAVHGHWNAEALGRAIENLLANAVKYGDAVRPVTVTLREEHARALLTVHNEGSYIPPGEREALFEAFRRSETARERGARGWGLGLALVRAVAEAHGGSIALDSLPETGTSFTVDVPLDSRPFASTP